MAVIVSDRLLTVGRGRDREGLMPAISGVTVTVRGLIRSAGRPGLVPISQPRQHCSQTHGQILGAVVNPFI